MKKDLVSVIVPIYKVEKYLRQCLDSIINQTYKNLEIILVDDGSPDNCPKICDEYARKDDRIKVIHKENGGLSSARNAGLDICKGEYISFIDSDDYIDSHFFSSLVSKAQSENADIVQCDFVDFFDGDNDFNAVISSNDKVYSNLEMQKKIFEPDGYRNVVVWNKIYKKYLFNKLRFPNGKINEDEFTTYINFDNSKIICVLGSKMYFYRKRENSIMGGRFNYRRFDAIEAYKCRVEYYERKKQNNGEYKFLFKKSVEQLFEKTKEFYFMIQDSRLDNKKELLDMLNSKIKSCSVFYNKSNFITLNYKKVCFFSKAPWLYFKMAKLKDKILFR